jgi:hypothetical protein
VHCDAALLAAGGSFRAVQMTKEGVSVQTARFARKGVGSRGGPLSVAAARTSRAGRRRAILPPADLTGRIVHSDGDAVHERGLSWFGGLG